jgi:hypothetical protein
MIIIKDFFLTQNKVKKKLIKKNYLVYVFENQ